MARQGPSKYLKPKDYMTLGLDKALVKKPEKILKQVLLWGTPNRKSGEPFGDYLFRMRGMDEAKMKKKFNRDQREKLKKDPQMKSCDVSLLYQCIRFGCNGLAPSDDDTGWTASMATLEGQITIAKNHRNSLVHGDYEINENVFNQKLREIETLITLILEGAARRFNKMHELQPLSKEFQEEIRTIRHLPFHDFPSSSLCRLFKIEGRKELQKLYRNSKTISPASNLIGKDIWVEIGTVFTQMEMYASGTRKQPLAVDKVFEYVDSHPSTKNKIFLLLEGVAGSGKTTLTRKILHEWSKGSSKMKLDDYDLAIWTECRDSATRSLTQLLRSLMPTVTESFDDDQLVVTNIQNNALLFIVDGLDELNKSSKQVFREILALENTDAITIVCTTRPNKVPDVKSYVPDTFEILHVNIKGISEGDRESFVNNYYQALQNHIGGVDISGLLQCLKEGRLHEHWRLPFNLVLLTVLWIKKPNIVNKMTTATELFLSTFELCKERLIQRLQDNEETSGQEPDKIRENLSPFVKGMAKIAFDGHHNDETELSRNYVNSLKLACHLKNLPPEEVMSSFLVQAVSLINKNRDKFSFPHKGLQDFFCALYIEGALEDKDTPLDISGIFSFIDPILEDKFPPAKKMSLIPAWKNELIKVLREASDTYPTVRSVFQSALKGVPESNLDQLLQLDLSKWRNILVHLTGLLSHRGGSLTDERGEEMVKLLEESGITDLEEWFDILFNVKCDAAISKHIVLRGRIQVTDARVEAFLKVLDRAKPDELEIDIKGDPSVTPGLKDLLVALREKDWKVRLFLHHDFQYPKEGGSILDETLHELIWSNLRFTVFKGQTWNSAFISRVKYLWLSVKNDFEMLMVWCKMQKKNRMTLRRREEEESSMGKGNRMEERKRMDKFKRMEEGKSSMEEGMAVGTKRMTMDDALWGRKRMKMEDEFYLAIHVPVHLDTSSLDPLPWNPTRLCLFVSDVDAATVEKASVVACKLQPYGESYYELRFPGVGRAVTDCERLIHELRRKGVKVNSFGGVVVSPSIDEGDKRRMKVLARRMLNCGFWTCSEDEIWTKEFYD